MPMDSAWPNQPNTTTSITKASWSVSSSHKMPWNLGFTAPQLPQTLLAGAGPPPHHSPPTPEPMSRHWSCPLGGPGVMEVVHPLPRPRAAHTQLGLHRDPAGGSGSQPSLKSTLSLPATCQPLKPRRDSSRQPPDHTELLSVSPDELLVCSCAQTRDRKLPAWREGPCPASAGWTQVLGAVSGEARVPTSEGTCTSCWGPGAGREHGTHHDDKKDR